MSVRTTIVRCTASVSLAAVAMTAAPSVAQAGHPCQSEWVKFKSFFDQHGVKIAKGICQLVNSKDAAAARQCVETFEKAKAKIDSTLGQYNAQAGDSSAKIGPRGLPEGVWATGTLLAERTFAGVPILSDTLRIQLVRTGGKAKKAMTGTVCFLDPDGNMALPATSFSIDEDRTTFHQTWNGVAGLTPVVLLEKPVGLNGHQYQITSNRGAEPAVVAQARAVK